MSTRILRTQACDKPRKAGAPAILLFGEILADVFPDRRVLGGAPFNVARHLAAFGLAPLLVGRIGGDALGDAVRAAMAACGMRDDGLQVDVGRPTGRVTVRTTDDGHSFEIPPGQAFDFIDPDAAGAASLAAGAELVYFGTLCQRSDTSRRALEAVLEAAPAPRFVDLNLREPWHTEDVIRFSLRQADILKLNAEELQDLGSLLDLPSTEPEDRVLALMRDYRIARVIVTCGAEGAWLVHEDGEWTATPYAARHADVIDTVGAGDGFAAVCILGAVSGWPVAKMLTRADAFASAICGIRGAVPDSAEFYRPFLEEWSP